MRVIFTLIVQFLLVYGWAIAPAPAQPQEGSKELEQAKELNAQVVKLYQEKRVDEALPLAQRVLQIRQRLLPGDDHLVLEALINLGELYLAAKKDSDAEKTLQLALKSAETGENEAAISRVLDSLAYLRIRKHDFSRADPLLLRSLEIKEKEWGPTNSQTVEAMKDYACLEIRNRDQEGMLSKDKDPERTLLRARAFCWLGELTSDCTQKAKVQTDDVMNGKALTLITPGYPPEARARHLAGSAYIAVLIDEDGNVSRARSVCGGNLELNQASVMAAQRSKFSPTKVKGEPVQVTGLIIYRFISQ
jgi:TonB family protein